MTSVTTVEVGGGEPEPAPDEDRPRRRPRWLLVAAAIAVGFVAAGSVTAGALMLFEGDEGAQAAAEEREAAVAYAAGIDQVAGAAGAILEFEMKPAMSEIAEGETDAVFAEGWAENLTDLRDGLAEQEVPAGLEEAHEGFLEALEGYARTAASLGKAAEAEETSEREQALDEAVARGNASDRTWNEAREQLEAHLRAHGIDVQVG